MNPSELDQAIQDTLDGVATPSQVSWLESRLQSDPAAREEFVRQQALFHRLAARPPVDPPTDLTASVMSAIRSLPQRGVARRDPFSALRELFAHRSAIVGAWSFAMGCLVGALLMFARSGVPWIPASRPLPVSATMGLEHPEGATTDRATWRAGRADGVIEIARAGNLASARAQVRSETPATVQLEFDPAAMTPDGFEWSDRSAHDLEVLAAGRIRYVSTGTTELIVRFRCAQGAEAAFQLRVDCDGVNSRAVVRAAAGAVRENEPKPTVH
jgi:hypothetical protein